MIDKYLTDNELVLTEYEDAIEIQRRLINNGYVVMLSREEQFWVLNWIWDSHDAANRNAAIFISREDYEWALYEQIEKEKEKEDGVEAD